MKGQKWTHGGPSRFLPARSGHSLLAVNAGTVIDLAPRAMWENAQLRTRGRPNLNHFCLTLEKPDWDKLRKRLAARQIALEGPVPRWGARGHGTSIYFHDPEGNEIEARYYGE